MSDGDEYWLAARRSLPDSPTLSVLAPELRRGRANGTNVTAIAGWGNYDAREHARRVARRRNLPLLLLNPGILTAPLFRSRSSPLISLTCLGIEKNGERHPGWAQDLLARFDWETPALTERAKAAAAALRDNRLGGAIGASLAVSQQRRVVAAADRGGDAGSAEHLLKSSLAAHDAGDILFVLPPQKRYAELSAHARRLGCEVATSDRDPWSMIEHAERIVTLGGDIGFLALLAGRQVRCAAETYYSGWGLTEDDAAIPQQAHRRSIDQLVAAACLLAPRYADPFTLSAASFENALDLVADWKRCFLKNQEIGCCHGISFWKRGRTGDFFESPAGRPAIIRSANRAIGLAKVTNRAIAYWPQRKTQAAFEREAEREGAAIIRIEDGFIRSVGLGTNLNLPASIVCDRRGMYYDPHLPSDLEFILAETQFDSALLQRARQLRDLLVSRKVTKYNLADRAVSLTAPDGQRRILVPGQFEDDKSVLLGGAGITSNIELLRRVRQENPDSFIVYKPHPDIEAGHRKGAIPDSIARQHCDTIIRSASILPLIEWAEEIHTLTSLTGFEALLRDRSVVIYGQPFYAGWGLTEDRAPVARRRRRLCLEELIAGTLILYSRYVDPVTHLPCGPETVIERIAARQAKNATGLTVLRELQGALFRRAKGLMMRL